MTLPGFLADIQESISAQGVPPEEAEGMIYSMFGVSAPAGPATGAAAGAAANLPSVSQPAGGGDSGGVPAILADQPAGVRIPAPLSSNVAGSGKIFGLDKITFYIVAAVVFVLAAAALLLVGKK